MRVPLLVSLLILGTTATARAAILSLESPTLVTTVDTETGGWTLVDRRSGVRWPSTGDALLAKEVLSVSKTASGAIRLAGRGGEAFVLALADGGRALDVRREGTAPGEVRLLDDLLAMTDREEGYALVPCREGLLVSARSGRAFRRTFGTSDYEGCHMNMLGFVKSGSALVVTWDDAYVFPELISELPKDAAFRQRLTACFALRRSARSVRLTPLGTGDWNTVAAGYRAIAERKGLAVTLREKIRRNAKAERMVGAANVKLWTCLARRMNEESTKEESVTVRWTFDEAARIAEHLHADIGIDRCLFILGGWTEGGYDCRHPDNLPANPECGGNAALTDAIARIQKLGYVVSLHDNVQDMYRDAPSWDPKVIEKRADGSLISGGRWLGGRAYMVCAPKQVELAQRPQNLPAIRKLFPAWSYFIDTTYAVGPRECHDPDHPIGRNEDIAWKIRLSDYAREMFGLFGSECGREWALPHSDFFEGLVAVSGRYYHNLDPARLGAIPVPFWEMVYHDCQICYGKYGYAADRAAEYVAHHVLCARPLHYHSIPDHLYWKAPARGEDEAGVRPHIVSLEPTGDRAFRIRYAWDVTRDVSRDWRGFVHFVKSGRILFQDDHVPTPPTPAWKRGMSIAVGPRTVHVPSSVREPALDVYMGLFDPDRDQRAILPESGGERRVHVGTLHLQPTIRLERARKSPVDHACYARSDQGWAEGRHPLDGFLKNTQEVLGPLHAATAHMRLTRFTFVTPDHTVRRAVYGEGETAVTVTVNFGETDAGVDSPTGGRVTLPPRGFLVESARFIAFHARRWNKRDYDRGALFTLRSEDGRPLDRSRKIRIFHAFGDPRLDWKGRRFEVRRERVVIPKPTESSP